MEEVVDAMTEIEFPSMRDEVRGALERLSDRNHQQAVWVEHRLPHENYYDELKLEIHILFDDIDVCEDPDRWVGAVLFPSEVEPFRPLGQALDTLLDDLGDAPDAAYLTDPRWDDVLRLAAAALAAMNSDEPKGLAEP